MSTLREQLEKLSNDNLVSFDKLLDTEFGEEIDYNNLDKKIELKQMSDSYYNIFTKKESEVGPKTSVDKILSNSALCSLNNLSDDFTNFKIDMKECIRDLKQHTEFLDKRFISLQRVVFYLILPLSLFCVYCVIFQIL